MTKSVKPVKEANFITRYMVKLLCGLSHLDLFRLDIDPVNYICLESVV